MKKLIYLTLLISLIYSYSHGQNLSTSDMPCDLWIKIKNTPSSGKFTFSIKNVGIIFSGDNYDPLLCPPF